MQPTHAELRDPYLRGWPRAPIPGPVLRYEPQQLRGVVSPSFQGTFKLACPQTKANLCSYAVICLHCTSLCRAGKHPWGRE